MGEAVKEVNGGEEGRSQGEVGDEEELLVSSGEKNTYMRGIHLYTPT